MLESWPRLQSVSIHNKLAANGFEGSYPTVVRAVREIRGPRFRAASAVSVPIHTDPGEEAQFDFCDLSSWAARFGWNDQPGRVRDDLVVVAVADVVVHHLARIGITPSRGSPASSTLAGGVPTACRTDRMGALGRSQGRRFELHAPTVGFAAHHGTKITSCQAGDAKRKGKVERPFRQLQETFLPEVEFDGIPIDLDDLNRRASCGSMNVSTRSSHAPPVRHRPPGWRSSADFLGALPRVRFDTDYVEVRRVHNVLPFVSIDANRYSVPPERWATRSRSAATSTAPPSRSVSPAA